MSPVEYFFRAFKIKSVLSVHAQMVFKFLVCLVQEKITMKFLLASLKTLTNSKNCSESRIKYLFRLSFALIGQLFPVYEVCSKLYQNDAISRKVHIVARLREDKK